MLDMKKIYFWIYCKLQPRWSRFEYSVRAEINRVKRIEAIKDGIERWKAFRAKHGPQKSEWDFASNLPTQDNIRKFNTWEERLAARQAKCRHLKGGRAWFHTKDYAIGSHIYIDGTQRMWCLLCYKEAWKHKVTPEVWDEFVRMAESSTNTTSTSERPLMKGTNNGPNTLSQ